MNINGYARFGMVWNEGTAAQAAVPGSITLAEARAIIANNGQALGLTGGAGGAVAWADMTASERADAVETAQAALTAATLVADVNTIAGDTLIDADGTVAQGLFNQRDDQLAFAEFIADAVANGAVAATVLANGATLAQNQRTLALIEDVIAAAEGTAAVAAVEDAMTTASRLRIQFDMGTTTDSGIGLNVRQRFQAEENGAGTGGNGARFGLTYGGFAVNVGNIIGVLEATPNLYMNTNSAGVGLEGNGFHSLAVSNYTAYSSGGAGATDGVEVIYSANGLRLHAHDTDGSSAFGGSFAMGDVTVAAAYEDFDTGANTTLLTAGMNIGAGWVAVAHGIDDDGAGTETDKTVLKGGYDVMPGANVYGFVSSADAGDAAGIGMSYDLGGGASFDAGYTNTAADLGILSAGIFFTF